MPFWGKAYSALEVGAFYLADVAECAFGRLRARCIDPLSYLPFYLADKQNRACRILKSHRMGRSSDGMAQPYMLCF